MNTDDGHLVSNESVIKLLGLDPKDYSKVPKRLEKVAEDALQGADSTYVDLGGGTKLAQWAERDRKKKKKVAARKEVRKARRRNRR